jgi:hypothetical protein
MNNTIEKENGSNHQLYLRYLFIAMSMNSEDKIHLHHFISVKGWEFTFISLGLIISNFDSLLISASMWVSSLYFGLRHLQCNKRKQNRPILGDLFKMVFKYLLNINSTIPPLSPNLTSRPKF